MSWSLGETSALVQKAVRGSGFPWGLAEEAATAVTWLQARNLPGVMTLCSYLGQHNAIATKDGDSSPACPIALGCAISDGVIKLPDSPDDCMDLGMVHSPVLLLGVLQSHLDGPYWLRARGKDFRPLATAEDLWDAGLMATAVHCEIRRDQTLQVENSIATQSRVSDQYECCIDQLSAFAHHTYAPATSQSRLSGAGAGLNDND